MTLADVLESEGYSVVEAENADAAHALLCSGTIVSVMVTDVRMPGEMDGLELDRRVAEQWTDIVIFVMSGHAYSDSPRFPTSATFLPKPLKMAQFAEQVARSCRGH